MEWRLYGTEKSESESAKDATSDEDCFTEVDATGNCFHSKGKEEVG